MLSATDDGIVPNPNSSFSNMTRDNMLLPVFADVLPLCRNMTLILTEQSRVIIRVDESEASLCS